MRVRIVCYEDIDAWILGKFARKLCEELGKLGVHTDISKTPDPDADINHHIIYLNYLQKFGSERDTLMITHINDIRKLSMLKKQLEVASVGICMSRYQMNELILGGIPKQKLCFVNPAHDEVIRPEPLTIGITTQVKKDGCKRESLLVELSDHISPDDFKFHIIGSGWEQVLDVLEGKGFSVEYHPEFDYQEYVKIVPKFDYYLYMGEDEGSMGFIDALAAGVKTIVTPQGFHLDAPSGITYEFTTSKDLIKVFDQISSERAKLFNAISTWTWRDYAIKHYEIWKYMISGKDQTLNSSYADGLNSLLEAPSLAPSTNTDKIQYKLGLVNGAWKRTFYKIKVGLSSYDNFKKKSKGLLGSIFKSK